MSAIISRNPPIIAKLSLTQLEEQITELAGHLNAANHRWLRLIAEFDRRRGWWDGRLRSCAHWLNFKCGLNLGAAREKLRVAHALEKLPRIAASMARGQLSYSKVRAMSRVADTSTEEYFLMIALHGTAHHVETLVRHFRRTLQVEELAREARQQENRHLRYWYDEDGSLVFKGRLPAPAGAALINALDAAMEVLPPSDIDEQWSETAAHRPTRRADALTLVAESFMENGPANISAADRYQVVVHVEAETLREDAAGRCDIEHGPSVSAETARRLACDASMVRIVENQKGDVLDVGRKTRTIPAAIRRALNSRDMGCRFPGCTHSRYVDAHHVRHWSQGGETKLGNLVTLCRFHHRYVHEESMTIQRQFDGTWRFLNADGSDFEIIPPSPSICTYKKVFRDHAALGIVIDPETAAPHWGGERMDYGIGVQVLMEQVARADVSAETLRD
jgi:hypothetical protein